VQGVSFAGQRTLLDSEVVIDPGERLRVWTSSGLGAGLKLRLDSAAPVPALKLVRPCSAGQPKRISISSNLNADPEAMHDENVARLLALLELSGGTPVESTHLVSGFDWSAPFASGLPKGPCIALDCPIFPELPAEVRPIPLIDFPSCFDSDAFLKQVQEAVVVSWYNTNHAVTEGILKGADLWEPASFVEFLTDHFGPSINGNLILALWLITCFSAQLALAIARLLWKAGMRKAAIMYVTDPKADPVMERQRCLSYSTACVEIGTGADGAPLETPLFVMPLRALLGVRVDDGELLTTTLAKTKVPSLAVSAIGMAWSGDENGDPTACPLLTKDVINLEALGDLRAPLIAAFEKARPALLPQTM
jgi:hypothetical protein